MTATKRSYQRRGPSDRPLTPRQLNALRLVAAGEPHHRIGAALGIAEKSVGKLLTEVFRKLGAVSAPNAVDLGHRLGLLDHRSERHGDHAGYTRHVRAGEEPRDCPHGCYAAELIYRAERRAARATAKEKTNV